MEFSYEGYINELKYMFNGFLEVSDSMRGVKSESSSNFSEIEGILKKVTHDTYSVILLAEEDKQKILLEGGYLSMFPYSSIISLSRCIFESYLVFNYIFISTQDDDDEFLYRFTLWQLDGFKLRQNFTIFKDESKAKMVKEQSVVTELYKDLYSNSKYKKLSKNEKKQFEKKYFRWHPDWTTVASMAGINKKHWRNTYGYMSQYAHSGYLSAFQIRQIYSTEEAKSQCSTSIQMVLIIIAKIISEYSTFHKNVANALESNKDLFERVNFWVNISEDLEKMYDDKG